jgi:hypothetical protein
VVWFLGINNKNYHGDSQVSLFLEMDNDYEECNGLLAKVLRMVVV